MLYGLSILKRRLLPPVGSEQSSYRNRLGMLGHPLACMQAVSSQMPPYPDEFFELQCESPIQTLTRQAPSTS